MKNNFLKNRKNGVAVLTLAAATLSANALPATAQMDATQPYYSSMNQGARIGVSVDGRSVDVGSVAPVQANNRVLVPLRGVLESLGATVAYDANTATVLAQRGTTQISLRIGSNQAMVNGQNRVLDVPAQTISGRTLVPLRFVAEALGANVSWDAAQRVVFISTNGTVVTPPIVTPPTATPGRYTTLNATVTRNLPGARRFEVLTDKGDLLQVQSRDIEPTTLSVNDRVQIGGTMTNGIFTAEAVRILAQSSAKVTARGTVTNVLSGTRLVIRTDNNRTLTIVSTRAFPSTLNRGDRITATGTQSGSVLRTAHVTALDSDPQIDGTPVDFTGTVISVDRNGRVLRVRGANRTVYVVRYFTNQSFGIGDNVRVIGASNAGITNATRIILR